MVFKNVFERLLQAFVSEKLRHRFAGFLTDELRGACVDGFIGVGHRLLDAARAQKDAGVVAGELLHGVLGRILEEGLERGGASGHQFIVFKLGKRDALKRLERLVRHFLQIDAREKAIDVRSQRHEGNLEFVVVHGESPFGDLEKLPLGRHKVLHQPFAEDGRSRKGGERRKAKL